MRDDTARMLVNRAQFGNSHETRDRIAAAHPALRTIGHTIEYLDLDGSHYGFVARWVGWSRSCVGRSAPRMSTNGEASNGGVRGGGLARWGSRQRRVTLEEHCGGLVRVTDGSQIGRPAQHSMKQGGWAAAAGGVVFPRLRRGGAHPRHVGEGGAGASSYRSWSRRWHTFRWPAHASRRRDFSTVMLWL
ncbi:DUF6192 family protein [Streptomyces canus]|uniref:DUF6192 family protein n=1 Tax=Streptomyces canus TaxID=58343 RepID=UPI00371ECA29